ncbi:hypothetical protein [Janibacter sp. G56]|uniref:hypothetical protein n=1 Tax=Janibacter sp. G56 TaxID=3418717 RepID=UPI003D0319E2
MHPRRTLATAGLAATLALALSACGQDEPTAPTSSAESSQKTGAEETGADDADTETAGTDEAAVDEVLHRYWELYNLDNPSKPPTAQFADLLTDDVLAEGAEFRKTFPQVRVEGRDEIVASDVTVASSTRADVEVCYRVHKKYIVTKAYQSAGGGTVKAGTDIRSDHQGRDVKDGTELVDLIRFERDSLLDTWQMGGRTVGHKPSCDLAPTSD